MNNKYYDAIIIGGGHNGLSCAAYLAKAGKSVLVLEAAEQLGGLGATREFAPGFKASVAHTLPQLTNSLVDELELRKHGFQLASSDLDTIALSPEGKHITVSHGHLKGASAEDTAAYDQYLQLMQKFSDAINTFWHKTPPMVGSGHLKDLSTVGLFGWKLRTLGKDDMREMMRMIALPAQDLMDEYFASPLLKAALSWDANVGSKLAPRSPNNAVLALLFRMSGDFSGSLPLPKGGVGGLVEAMAKSASSFGAEIKTGSPVATVIVEEHRATGVTLENGETFSANTIISNADPKTSFFKLVGARYFDVQFTHRINRLRNDGFVAKVHLALDGLPNFKGLDSPTGRMMIAPSMQSIENAFDQAKYGSFAEELPMEVLIPSLHDDSLAAAGKHVLSAQVQYAPYAIKGGWQQHREQFLENVIATLEKYAPDIRSKITASELLTPEDLEQQFRVSGGHWHHAEFALDNWWMNRPTYGASQYKTPLPGFYLCGAGAHPGGGIMGAAGANAAKAILDNKQ
ncbi:phytoene desaturase family protein [Oceanicoccus sagamiensis]|uniref:Pyridine nucleotide-disulfide oxidoreductase domain-containing protein 2 n=1 Tax=Oceanicoccus sagamiensis TaxID=716816 RepID=A0A1X9NCZ1_9GAMM|nr:NAD(P)/FAD-dependent oxidoreductase [Oceanicoccus sagamiensis]ARN75908.1 phytoene dehydrogenase [Oceanicoccus sagamiensis]